MPPFPTHPVYYSLVIKFYVLCLSKFRVCYVRFYWKRLRAYTNDRLCINYACFTCLLYCASDVNVIFKTFSITWQQIPGHDLHQMSSPHDCQCMWSISVIKACIKVSYGDVPKKQDGPGLYFARSSEFQFGVRRKNGYNPGAAGSEFGERTGITLVRQVRSSEKGQFRSLEKEPGPTLVRQVRSSEKGQFLSPNSEP